MVARPDEKWGESPCAFVTLKSGAQRDARTRSSPSAATTWRTTRCRRPWSSATLPKTSTGKIQKFVLREQAAALGDGSAGAARDRPARPDRPDRAGHRRLERARPPLRADPGPRRRPVAVAARRTEQLAALCDEIEGHGGRAMPVRLDVTDCATASSRPWPRRDRARRRSRSWSTMPASRPPSRRWRPRRGDGTRSSRHQPGGAWLIAQAAARHMARLGHGGSIVNIASILGLAGASAGPGLLRRQGGPGQPDPGPGRRAGRATRSGSTPSRRATSSPTSTAISWRARPARA